MDIKFYLPYKSAEKLAYFGFSEECDRVWNRHKTDKKLLNPTRYQHWNWGSESQYDEDRPEFLEKYLSGGVQRYNKTICAMTYEQAEEWILDKYKVSFYKRPHVGRDTKYICDPIGGAFGTAKLEARDTPREALLQALTFVLENVQPLPLQCEPTPKDEEEEYDDKYEYQPNV